MVRNGEITLEDAKRVLRRFWWILPITVVCCGTIAMSLDYNVREGITPGESHVLLLLSTSGMMILAAARDLIIVFLGIELM